MAISTGILRLVLLECKMGVVNGESLERDLVETHFFEVCSKAFIKATGLPLTVVSASHPNYDFREPGENRNRFCHLLNTMHSECDGCVHEQTKLFASSIHKGHSHTCFAGLTETAVPLRLGQQTVAFLKTGQVFTREPVDRHLDQLQDVMKRTGIREDEEPRLMECYRNTKHFDAEKYNSMITLLGVISLQLSSLLNRLLLEEKACEPDGVRRAKKYAVDHIGGKLALEEVAKHVNMSESYFCRIFKRSTGMTFGEFIGRQRIELAKKELETTDKQVADIANLVGFHSLSQFNRSFIKYAGETPTHYRLNMQHVPKTLMIPM